MPSRKPPPFALHAFQQHRRTAFAALSLRPGLPVSCLPLGCFPSTLYRNNSLSEGTYGMPAVLQHKRTQVGRDRVDRVAREAASGVLGACHSGPQAWMTSLCSGEASECCNSGRLRQTLAAALSKLHTKRGSRLLPVGGAGLLTAGWAQADDDAGGARWPAAAGRRLACLVLGVRVGTSAAAESLLCKRVYPELAQKEATLSYMADWVPLDAHSPRLTTSSARCRRQLLQHCCIPAAAHRGGQPLSSPGRQAGAPARLVLSSRLLRQPLSGKPLCSKGDC